MPPSFRLWREPLVHFACLGALLFALGHLLHPESRSVLGKERLVVSRGTFESLRRTYAVTWGRPPSAEELDALVSDFVDEELLYRRALALGFERDDTVVRRRLRQKMELWVESEAETRRPSEAELADWLARHPDLYRSEARVSFRQVYLGQGTSDALGEKSRLVVEVLESGGDPSAFVTASQLPRESGYVSSSEVSRRFGDVFAARLEQLPVGVWTGPIASGFGQHVVLVEARRTGQVPPLDEVRAAVERDVRVEQTRSAQSAYLAALRSDYDIVIERPERAPAAVAHAETHGDAAR
jgi:hypothetical protein